MDPQDRISNPIAAGVHMSQSITARRVLGVFEHVLAIVVGFTLMILGLGLSVTMIMLPVGLIVGLAGVAMFIAGMCVRFDWV
jgi:membrane-bound ClpP family serine protease